MNLIKKIGLTIFFLIAYPFGFIYWFICGGVEEVKQYIIDNHEAIATLYGIKTKRMKRLEVKLAKSQAELRQAFERFEKEKEEDK